MPKKVSLHTFVVFTVCHSNLQIIGYNRDISSRTHFERMCPMHNVFDLFMSVGCLGGHTVAPTLTAYTGTSSCPSSCGSSCGMAHVACNVR